MSRISKLAKAATAQQLKDWLRAFLIVDYDYAAADKDIWIGSHNDSDGNWVDSRKANPDEVKLMKMSATWGQLNRSPLSYKAIYDNPHANLWPSPSERVRLIAKRIRTKFPSVAPYEMYNRPEELDHSPGPAERQWAEEKLAEFNVPPTYGSYSIKLEAKAVDVVTEVNTLANSREEAMAWARENSHGYWNPKVDPPVDEDNKDYDGHPSPPREKIEIVSCEKEY